ncbi:MAG: hypothetical protein AAF619_06415 [Pseudomonadota bacterium]
MARRWISAVVAAVAALGLQASPGLANDSTKMLHKMVGTWKGNGHLAYTQEWTFNFKCEIEGKPGIIDRQVDLMGRCWSGPIWSSMGAALRYNPRTKSYVGKFRDGTSTFVIDIAGKRSGQSMALDLSQGHQRGALDMTFQDQDSLVLSVAIVDPRTKARRKVVDLNLERQPTRLSRLD